MYNEDGISILPVKGEKGLQTWYAFASVYVFWKASDFFFTQNRYVSKFMGKSHPHDILFAIPLVLLPSC